MVKSLNLLHQLENKDSFGHLLLKSFDELNMRKDGIFLSDTYPTAVFLGVINPDGGMEIGVADMD